MADFLKILDGKTLADVSVNFNYEEAVKDFVGLKLLPMEKTANLKVAMYQLLKGNDIPVIALVHAFDSEARIGDRPMYKEIEAVGYYADYDDSTRIAQIGIYFVDEAALGENSALWEILSYADAVHVLKPEGDELEGYDALRFDVNICC